MITPSVVGHCNSSGVMESMKPHMNFYCVHDCDMFALPCSEIYHTCLNTKVNLFTPQVSWLHIVFTLLGILLEATNSDVMRTVQISHRILFPNNDVNWHHFFTLISWNGQMCRCRGRVPWENCLILNSKIPHMLQKKKYLKFELPMFQMTLVYFLIC